MKTLGVRTPSCRVNTLSSYWLIFRDYITIQPRHNFAAERGNWIKNKAESPPTLTRAFAVGEIIRELCLFCRSMRVNSFSTAKIQKLSDMAKIIVMSDNVCLDICLISGSRRRGRRRCRHGRWGPSYFIIISTILPQHHIYMFNTFSLHFLYIKGREMVEKR